MNNEPAEGHSRRQAAPKAGDQVRFAAADVFLPGEEAEFDGRIVEFSDSGARKRAYAVVEVLRRQMMVVPVEKLEKVETPAGDPGKEPVAE